MDDKKPKKECQPVPEEKGKCAAHFFGKALLQYTSTRIATLPFVTSFPCFFKQGSSMLAGVCTIVATAALRVSQLFW
ncbi:MAG: hypothetical protein CSA34_02105 [Desulfobulbus propionicus]|nr:MAG: hypothetical protein CSA34_02105 [Desulfobulbus propionicus]